MRAEGELALPRLRASLCEVCEAGIDLVEIDEIGIKRAAGPDDGFVEFFVTVVGNDLEELGIAIGAANVLGGTATGGVQEKRVGEARDCQFDFLNLDRVGPGVAKIVEVLEREGLVLIDRPGQAGGAGIGAIGLPAGSGMP